MNKIKTNIWPVIAIIGIIFHITLVYFMRLINPNYVFSDENVKATYFIILIGVVGSIVNILHRFGLKKTAPILVVFIIAALSLTAAYTGNDFSAIGWALIAYLLFIIGVILVIVYSFRSPK